MQIPKPKKGKTQRKKLIIQLDNASKEAVRERDGNICQHCGRVCEGSNRHVSHVIPVSHGHSLRWDVMNMKILCYHCHINWWHKNPLEASDWFREKFPERMKYIEEHNFPHKYTEPELEELLQSFKK